MTRKWLKFLETRPKTFLAVWVVFFGLMAAGAGHLKNNLKVGGFSIPGTQFHEASAILTRDFGMASEKLLVAVFTSKQYRASEVEFQQAAQKSLDRLKMHRTVERIESFYNTGIPDLVSRDNHTTYALVHLKGTEEDLERSTPEYRALVKLPDASSPVEVALTGQPVANFDIEVLSTGDVAKVDVVTFPLILILLIIFLGAWRAGVVPLALGICTVVLALGGVFILTLFTPISVFAQNIATMIGLGLSVDFSLILLFRYQEELAAGLTPRKALEESLTRSGKSVFFSGFTLFTTVSILTLFPIMIIRSIAQAILVSTLSALIVFFGALPFVVLKWGPKLKPKAKVAKKKAAREGFLLRLTRASIAKPWNALALTLAVLLTFALPTLFMRRIGTTLEGVPPKVESRHAVDLLQQGFGPGAVAPLMLVLHTPKNDGLWTKDGLRLIHEIHAELSADPRVEGVRSLMSLVPNPSEKWALTLSKPGIASNADLRRVASRFVELDGPTKSTFFMIYSKHAETHPETIALLEQIRSRIPAWQAEAKGLRLTLGGTPAQHYDFDKAVYNEAPPLVLMSLAITFLVLLIFFRSVFLPVKAILMNLISLVASFGIMVLVFQKGYGAFLLGFKSLAGVQVYTPVLLFSILFGLSTDYEVFVLSRVKEYLHEGHSTREAALLGIQKSARVIGAAATVMVLVFFSFAFSSVVAVKEIGFSLAVAVLIDATIVRMALVPASLVLMERLNWWFPRSLGRFVPEVAE